VRLEWRTIVLHERKPARDVPPNAHDVRAFRKLFWIEIAKTGEGALSHRVSYPASGDTCNSDIASPTV
jgi:hypothetical protein